MTRAFYRRFPQLFVSVLIAARTPIDHALQLAYLGPRRDIICGGLPDMRFCCLMHQTNPAFTLRLLPGEEERLVGDTCFIAVTFASTFFVRRNSRALSNFKKDSRPK
jgi:hypothetical protein